MLGRLIVRAGYALALPVAVSACHTAGAAGPSPSEPDTASSVDCTLNDCGGPTSAAGSVDEAPSVPPAQQIRFATPEGAVERRAKLVDYIWGHALPDTKPELTEDVELPEGLDDVDESSIARVDRLDARIADTDVSATSYVLRPAVPSTDGERFVLIHQGHSGIFSDGGLGRAATSFLDRGYVVIAMHMPLFGWNPQPNEHWSSHDAMFDGVPDAEIGRVFRFFLEPIVQNVTWATASASNLRDVALVGLSGGGWSTAIAAAIDPRIQVSFEVAGSAPLYTRIDDNDIGDREQFETTLFGEDIAPDGSGGGVATWLEIYTLAGFGPNRRAFQIHNELDPCCFAGNIDTAYASIVSDRVHALGGGEWSFVLDVGSSRHEISEWALDTVLTPAIEDEQ